MKKLLSALLFSLCALTLFAQKGSYFLTHHSPSEKNFDNVCFDILQDDYGIIYFAVKAGILEFDGREWDLIPGAGAIYGMHRSATGEIFWVGAKGFGKIGLDEKGFKKIQYLSDSSVTNAFQILSAGKSIWFLSENRIFRYANGEGQAAMILSSRGENMFTGMFELFGRVYVQTERNTTFLLENDQLVYVNLNFSGNVLFQSRIGDTYMFGTSDNRVYSCGKDLVVKQVMLSDQPYADANVLVGGTWVSEELLALGTLRGGVMLVHPKTGARNQIIDYATGLPDNEVFSLMADANQNIWVAHEYGYTQISPSLPFRSFSYYAGLEGNLLCAYSHQKQVYVGTSLGLFKLDRDEVYDEVITYVEVDGQERTTPVTSGESVTSHDDETTKVQDETPKRRGLFGFLRRNRKKSADPDGEPSPAGEKNVRLEKRVEKVLRSSQHIYKRVAGIGAKISHIVEVDGKLIAAGLEGVFHVNDLEAQPIMHTPTRYIYASEAKRTVIASTYNDEIWSIQFASEWQTQNLISSLGDQIEFIFEGPGNEWWLCGLDRIYQLQFGVDGISQLRTIEVTNPNFEKTVGLFFDNQITFVNNDGFFRFDRKGNQLVKVDTLARPYQYFAMDGHILYRDEHRWSIIGQPEERKNLQLLNLFHNLRFITADQDPQNLWMISSSNELLKFEGAQVTPIQNRFPIFLKSIQNNAIKIADFSHVEIDQNSSAVTFEVVQPDFINPGSVEFRYFLEGMHTNWSEWSSANNKINFAYLPPGEYNLQVEARNIFGRVSQLAPFRFEVIPPYWKRWWFYAMEFAVFASLVILSFRLSGRYHIVSRLLSLITIILLIEFIQTVIGSSIVSDDTPVVEFFIQVIVALLVLPVEGFLRKLMLKSLDTNSRIYRLISAGEVSRTGGKRPPRKRKIKESL